MNLFELFVKIGVDDQASSKLEKITSKLGNGLKTAAKIGTAAISIASGAVVALTKNAVENYAEYEQLVGGAELMFGEAFDFVKQKSQEAYKTVQMSQNEYLQQVNGFATGLKTSLGGNEKAAAQLADRIVTAEADIIAATGNAAENVQNAFNGIMKSNFTMLDNLQIGITPTKEGFQDLIDKVNDWNATNGKATKYQMGNLADMQNALVDYIDMVGYSGYAQDEAARTIQGSLSSTKAAWSNLLTGLADDEADFETLVNNLVTTVAGDGTESNPGLIGNILPRIEDALGGASDLIGQLFPVIMDKIPSIIESTLPNLANSAVKIVESLINGISSNQESLMNTIFTVIETILNGFLPMLPQIIELGLNLIVSLAEGIGENLDELIPTIIDVILKIVDTLTDPETLKSLLSAALEIITELAWGLIANIDQLMDAVFTIIENLVLFLTDGDNIGKIIMAALSLVLAIGTGLIKYTPKLLSSIATLIVNIVNSFKNYDWASLGRNLVDGFKRGISNAWQNLKTWFKNLFGDLIGIAKRILGIASPSKVFKKLGGFTAEGFGIGWEDEFANVNKELEKSLAFDNLDPNIGINASVKSVKSSSNGTTSSGMFGGTVFSGLTININGAKYSDENSLVESIAERLQMMTERKEAVYA